MFGTVSKKSKFDSVATNKRELGTVATKYLAKWLNGIADVTSVGNIVKPELGIVSGVSRRVAKGLESVIEFVIPASSKGHFFQNDQSYLQFRINNATNASFIIDASAFSILNKVEVFFGGNRMSSIFCVFSRLSTSTNIHTIVPSVATTNVLSAAEVVPINSSEMNGASSTFINGDAYLTANGVQLGGITDWRLRMGGENYNICYDPRVEGRFELMKAFHKLNSSDQSSSITEKQYLEEAFIIGIFLESYCADQTFYDGKEFSNAGSVQLKVITISCGLMSYKE
ncbi:hypothetical protein T492DRAFT_832927 [Pavlovales sp. CCMP2436]|nr:hypothetical protein T492DRAFT_832927 [Pavlovales sp. CCMP2436]